MGDNGNSSADWKNERLAMTHLGNFSRSSSYVRTLVRQQFHHQSDQSTTAWERLRKRLEKQGSYEYDEEIPNFFKKKQMAEQNKDEEEQSSDSEDGDSSFVFLKSANETHHRTAVALDSGQGKKSVSPSNDGDSALSTRRLSAPPPLIAPDGSVSAEKRYTLPCQDAHSKILNRRLSLAESVMKNYSKYIRTPEESKKERNTLTEATDESTNNERKSCILKVSEEKRSPLVDVKLVACGSPGFSQSGNFLTVRDIFSGSLHTEPSSPAAKCDSLFFNVPPRRNSHSGLVHDDLPLGRNRVQVMPKSGKDKQVQTASKKLQTLSAKGQKENPVGKSRKEAIETLRAEHEKLAKNPRLKKRVGRKRETVFSQLQRDQERRAKESAIFNHEMEEITKTLKAINNRLDERIKILDGADTPKVNARLQRILQVALAGVPGKNF